MSNITRDFLGNEIEEGDEVVYMSVHYRELKKGIIKKITPKMVQLLSNDLPDNGEKLYWDRQTHKQVVKV